MDGLPVLRNVEGLLSTAEKCAELGVTSRTLANRVKAGTLRPPAGRLPGLGSRGHLYWHPEEET